MNIFSLLYFRYIGAWQWRSKLNLIFTAELNFLFREGHTAYRGEHKSTGIRVGSKGISIINGDRYLTIVASFQNSINTSLPGFWWILLNFRLEFIEIYDQHTCDNTAIVSKLRRSEAFYIWFWKCQQSTQATNSPLDIPFWFFSLSNEDFIMKQQEDYWLSERSKKKEN